MRVMQIMMRMAKRLRLWEDIALQADPTPIWAFEQEFEGPSAMGGLLGPSPGWEERSGTRT